MRWFPATKLNSAGGEGAEQSEATARRVARTEWIVLPLSDATAARLVDILLTAEPTLRSERIGELLASDPWFALWISLRDSCLSPRPVSDRLLGWLFPIDCDLAAPTAETCAAFRAAATFAHAHAKQVADFMDVPEDEAAPGTLALLAGLMLWWQTHPHQMPCAVGQITGRLPSAVRRAIEATPAEQISAAAQTEVCSSSEASPTPEPSPDSGKEEAFDPSIGACDRLWELVELLGRVHELETAYDTVLQQEKLASLKQLAYGASHEINNPLANISVRAQTLLRDETDPDRRHKLATINAQAFRAHEMISDLMLFASPPALKPERFDLVQMTEQVLRELQDDADDQATVLTLHAATAPIAITADADQLSVALRALCINSLEALGSGGTIEVALSASAGSTGLDSEQHEQAEISVTDDGPGMDQQTRRHLFDPFYSGREAGRGLGFGLSKCWRIVDLHGGSISYQPGQPRGTQFKIRLPLGADVHSPLRELPPGDVDKTATKGYKQASARDHE